MGKTLKPDNTEGVGQLAHAEAPVRAIVLSELTRNERVALTEKLVESAMIMGLYDENQIKDWLGVKDLDARSVIKVRARIKERWLAETANVFDYAQEQRATQIKKAWEEVRTCERLFQDAVSTSDKVRVKKLQLEWMQYISKLSLVDKMVEASQPDMQIIVEGAANFGAQEDGD